MKKQLTVTIGIPAYNSGKNIETLINEILQQKNNLYILEKVIVHSDSSQDNTVKVVQSIKSSKITLIDSKQRKGFAGSIKTLLQNCRSDIMILLNDDIVIEDINFIEKIIKSFVDNSRVGLSSSNLIPFKAKTFIEESVRSGYIAYSNFSKSYKDGNNILTCDGKVLALSRNLINKLNFPENLNNMGNVDTYMYALCKIKKFEYKFSNDANAYFRCPSTINDFIKWQKRNYQNRILIHKQFHKLLDIEYDFPKMKVIYYKLFELIKNPLPSICILLLGLYCSINISIDKTEFNSKWDLVQSTKVIKT